MAAAVDRRPRNERMAVSVDEDGHEDAAEVCGTNAVLRDVRFVRLLEVPLEGGDAADRDPADEDLPLSLSRVDAESLGAAHRSHGVEAAEDLRPDPAPVWAAAVDVLRQPEIGPHRRWARRRRHKARLCAAAEGACRVRPAETDGQEKRDCCENTPHAPVIRRRGAFCQPPDWAYSAR